MKSLPSKIIVSVALVAVTVSVAAGAARVTWSAAELNEGPHLTRIAPQGKAAEAQPPPDLTVIAALSPFGEVVVEAAPEPVAEETSLRLTLHGVLNADPASASIAYISHANEPAKPIGVDEPISGPTSGVAILREVNHDHVVLEVDERRETLSFPKAGDTANSSAAAVRARIANSNGGQAMPAANSTPNEAIEFWRNRIARNPKDVLKQLGLEATADGYAIADNAHSAVRRAGFKPGDVVARVNGVQVGDVEADRSLYDEIAASGRARVELVRNGQSIIMSFPLK